MMLNKLLFILSALIVLIAADCSSIDKISYLKPYDDISSGWRPYDEYKLEYIFKYKNLEVVMCQQPHALGSPFLGPPLLPIIPTFFLFPTEPFYSVGDIKPFIEGNFTIIVGIESGTDEMIIDFSKVRLEMPEEKILQPIMVHSWRADRSPLQSACYLYSDPLARQKVPIQRIIVTNEPTLYEITFDIPHMKVDEFIFDFGDIVVDGNNIKLLSLRYHRHSKYFFRPFFIPGPG